MYTDPWTAHTAYRHGEITSGSPVRIVVLLYEGAIQACRQAESRFNEARGRGEALGRAHRIVSELLSSLNPERGGEIATNLDALYRFVLDSITRAIAHGDQSALPPVIQVLDTLVGAWREIDTKDLGQGPIP